MQLREAYDALYRQNRALLTFNATLKAELGETKAKLAAQSVLEEDYADDDYDGESNGSAVAEDVTPPEADGVLPPAAEGEDEEGNSHYVHDVHKSVRAPRNQSCQQELLRHGLLSRLVEIC